MYKGFATFLRLTEVDKRLTGYSSHVESVFVLTQRRRGHRVMRRVALFLTQRHRVTQRRGYSCKPLMEYTEYQGGENSKNSMLPQ
jgi:hypothetical protein